MNWRAWAHDILTSDPAVTADVPPEHVHAANSLVDVPEYEPFLLVSFRNAEPGPFPTAKNKRVQVWVHDRGGSMVRIDRILDAVRGAFERAVSRDEFISAVWEGNSNDTVDDALHTNVRSVTFRLAGKDAS